MQSLRPTRARNSFVSRESRQYDAAVTAHSVTSTLGMARSSTVEAFIIRIGLLGSFILSSHNEGP